MSRLSLIVCGVIFFSAVLYFNWDLQYLGNLKLQNSTEVWLVRLMYIHLMMCAVYRECAQALEGDFPPYSLSVMLMVSFVPVLCIYGFIRYF